MNHPEAPYHHLTLTFAPHPQHVALRWEAAVLGMRESRMVLPFAPGDLPTLLRALDCLQHPNYALLAQQANHPWWFFSASEQATLAGYGLWDAQRQLVDSAADRRVGRLLFAALTADTVAQQALETVRNHAVANGVMLWLALRFPPYATELAALPWEALRDSLDQPLLLSGGQQAICVRHLDLPLALPPILPVQRPLDVLALAPKAHIPASVRQAERTARRTILAQLEAEGLIRLRELEPVTRTALVNAINERPADLIYFYGHGHYQAGQGGLLLDGEHGGEAWTDSQRLAKVLAEAKIVLLFACRGAALLPDTNQPAHGMLSGVAHALNAEGIPLVLAMQFTVRISAATRAVELLVRDLNGGHSIQASAARMRRALFVEEEDQRSWYVPTLTIRSREIGPLRIFAPAQAQPMAQTALLPSADAPQPTHGPGARMGDRDAMQGPHPLAPSPASGRGVTKDDGCSVALGEGQGERATCSPPASSPPASPPPA
ncbi:MAG: CHAT domain-containing protein, partial [Candidatus Viridilinea halotolerans]